MVDVLPSALRVSRRAAARTARTAKQTEGEPAILGQHCRTATLDTGSGSKMVSVTGGGDGGGLLIPDKGL